MPAKTDPSMSADPSDDSSSAGGSRFSALLRGLGLGRREREDGEDIGDAGASLRSQAELFQTITVGDVMTPRADITAMELSSPFRAVVASFAESEHTRIPVYRETLDDPVGVVHLKDIFAMLADPAKRQEPEEPVLARVKRPTLYVPPSMLASDLLLRMQTSRIHMAMVIDEFGGVDGLVTLEDVIEAVVGDIDDEHDEAATSHIVNRPGGVLEVDGRVHLEALEGALEAQLAAPELEEEIETAAGLVTALAGRVPERGETIVHPAGFEFEVTDADPRRVKRLRVRRTGGGAA
ncbi:MAG TPA: hemolysin family protein [Caulobacteraceae bacterium]|jgi:CBS domain containing-hemolysin-like protein